MDEHEEVVHAHQLDSSRIIEEYRQKGYVLKEQTEPTIVAQAGFQRLVFVPKGIADLEAQAAGAGEGSDKRAWLTRLSLLFRIGRS